MDEKLDHHDELLSELRDDRHALCDTQNRIHGTLEQLLDQLSTIWMRPNKGHEQVQVIGDGLFSLPVLDARPRRPQ